MKGRSRGRDQVTEEVGPEVTCRVQGRRPVRKKGSERRVIVDPCGKSRKPRIELTRRKGTGRSRRDWTRGVGASGIIQGGSVRRKGWGTGSGVGPRERVGTGEGDGHGGIGQWRRGSRRRNGTVPVRVRTGETSGFGRSSRPGGKGRS